MTTNATKPTRKVILAAIDDSPAADRVIAEAAAIAMSTRGAEIHVLYASDARVNDVHRVYIDRRAREALAASNVAVVAHVREGRPAEVIVQLAASLDADLVIVGTRDRRGIERWTMGSVAARVVARAACPVLVVRPKDHAAGRAPEIDPPCADCLDAQRTSAGAKLWCAHHTEHHRRAHVYYELAEGFGAGSNLILQREES